MPFNIYDRDNRLTELKYDDGTHKVSYTYDELGRVASRVAVSYTHLLYVDTVPTVSVNVRTTS